MAKQKTEEQVVKRAIGRLKRAGGDPGKRDKIAKDFERELPKGKIKDFFGEVDNLFAPVYEVSKKPSNEELEKVLPSLRAARAKFEKGEYPKKIPQEIVTIYRDCLDQAITLVNERLSRSH